MSTLFIADCFVCIVGGLVRGLSGTDMLSAVVKSLFFSYAMGIVLIIVAVRYFGRVIGVTKVYPVGMLRYFVVLGSLSVIMGLALVLGEAPAKPPTSASHSFADEISMSPRSQIILSTSENNEPFL
jgi:hypothetical protein